MILALLRLIALTLLFSALLTPWICEIIKSLADVHVWPFSRVFDRVAMGVVVILLLFERKSFPLKDLKTLLKMDAWSKSRNLLLLGMFASLGSTVLGVPVLDWMDKLHFAPLASNVIVSKTISALASAILVALIEELFFRGLLYQRMKVLWSPLAAASITSAVYALVHFIAPVKSWSYTEFHWWLGFDYLSVVLSNLFVPSVLPAFLGLFLVGMTLCLALERSRSIFLCIGLHAGWVMCVKLTNIIFDFGPGSGYPSGRVAQFYLVTQPVAWVTILLVALGLFWIYRKPEQRSVD